MTVPATTVSTLASLGRYRWAPPAPGKVLAFNQARFPRTNVVGEIKPHNGANITAGIYQLLGRSRAGKTPQLVTYSQVRHRPSSYDVWAADSEQLRTLLASLARRRDRRLRPGDIPALSWYRLARIDVPQALATVPLWYCASTFGSVIEESVRAAYARKVGAALPRKSGHHGGPDISHERELVAFLRELAAELETELDGD